MDITRWSTLKSDWLYALQPKKEKLYSLSKMRLGADCGSDHELFIAKFRLKLLKVASGNSTDILYFYWQQTYKDWHTLTQVQTYTEPYFQYTRGCLHSQMSVHADIAHPHGYTHGATHRDTHTSSHSCRCKHKYSLRHNTHTRTHIDRHQPGKETQPRLLQCYTCLGLENELLRSGA